jgi:ABC-type Na+ efflux pump permease subunit
MLSMFANRKMWCVARREAGSFLRNRSFYLTVFGIPVIYLVVICVVAVTGTRSAPKIGLVDPAHLIQNDSVVRFTSGPFYEIRLMHSEERARSLLIEKQINTYVTVPEDAGKGGRIRYFGTSQFLDSEGEHLAKLFLRRNQAGLSTAAVDAVLRPSADYSSPTTTEQQLNLPRTLSSIFFACYFVVIFWVRLRCKFSIRTGLGNRTLEMELTSAEAAEVVCGKILGQTIVNLLQLMAWVGLIVLPVVGLCFLGSGKTLSETSMLHGLGTFCVLLGFSALGQVLLISSFIAAADNAPVRVRDFLKAFLVIVVFAFGMFLLTLLANLFGISVLREYFPIVICGIVLCVNFPIVAPLFVFFRLMASSPPVWECFGVFVLMSLGTYAAVRIASRRLKHLACSNQGSIFFSKNSNKAVVEESAADDAQSHPNSFGDQQLVP